MSKETERFLKTVSRELSKQDFASDDEMQAFMDRMNADGWREFMTSFDDADKAFAEYELGCELMASDDPQDVKQAVRHLKKAIELDPPFFDAQLELLEVETDLFAYAEKLQELEVKAEQGCLEVCGMERDEVYGEAWGCVEMRPLLRIKLRLAQIYLDQGMRRLAMARYEDILAWNENDNQGARYALIGIYAYFEDKAKAVELYERYSEEKTAWNLISLAALHYKLGDSDGSLGYVKQLVKSNPEAADAIARIVLEGGEDYEPELPGHYKPFSGEEVVLALSDLDYLLISSPAFLTSMVAYCMDIHKGKKKGSRGKKTGGKKPKGKSK
jgi:tetratricopeptide (TPR) repeat protein